MFKFPCITVLALLEISVSWVMTGVSDMLTTLLETSVYWGLCSYD